MKRRVNSFNQKSSSNDSLNKKEHDKQIFSKLSSEDYQEHPELYSAVNYDKQITFDFLSKDKPKISIRPRNTNNKHNDDLEDSINSFRKVYFEYNQNEKKSFHNYYAIQKENTIFTRQYSNLQKRNEKLNKEFSQFSDIKTQYEKKGVKVPKLSFSHNIFNQNILLLGENEIEKFMRFNQGAKENQSKSMKYLEKLNDNILNLQITGKKNDLLGGMIKTRRVKISNILNTNDNSNNGKKLTMSPSQEINMNTKEIIKTKDTFNNMDEIDDFFSAKKNYYGIRGKYNCGSRETSGKISTRVNSALNNELTNIKYQSVLNQKRIISGLKKKISISQISSIENTINDSKIKPSGLTRKSIRNVYNYISNNRKSNSQSCKNILLNSKPKSDLENLYEEIRNVDNSMKYNSKIKEFLTSHNYVVTQEVSPRIINQEINNSRDKFFTNDIIKKDVELRKLKKIKGESYEKEDNLILKNKKIEKSLQECQTDLCKIVYNNYK